MAKIRSFKPKQQNQSLVSSSQSSGMLRRQISDARPQTSESQAVDRSIRQTGKSVRLISLGGVGGVTKNMYVYEYGEDIVIVDCGLGFPEEGMLGIDLVIPDITYLKDKKARIRGIVISHGHEDHIGALPFIWPELDVPIYGMKLSCGLIRAKFAEHKLPRDKIRVLDVSESVKLGAFDISFYRASHSIPDTVGIVMRTPVGTLIHQSDFKMDWTPVNGQVTDIAQVAKVGSSGVLFMTIDSLRIEREGFNPSEWPIQKTLADIEADTKGKMLVTMTSSNITRVQQLVNIAAKVGRKLAVAGRSMESTFQVARDLGYLKVPPGLVIPQEEIKRVPDEKLIVLIAGSQGQPESALSRVANHDHKYIKLGPNDVVVISADPIPLSMMAQLAMLDVFAKQDIEVYWSPVEENLHVGGHASRDEIKLMLNLAKPQYVMPIGGTFRHTWAFKKMAQEMGYKKEQVLVPKEGDVIEISPGRVVINGRVEAFNVYVDGLGIGDVGNVVLRDRQTMAEEGIVVVMVPLNKQSGMLGGEPEIISRGFVFEKTQESLLEAAGEIVKSVLTERHGPVDWRYTRKSIEEHLERFFYEEIKRQPLILPVVVEL